MSAFLRPQDIPAPMMAQIRDTFDRNPQVVELRAKANRLQQQGYFVEAMQVRKQVDMLFDHAVSCILQEAEEENEKASLSAMDMPKEAQKRMTELTTAMLLAVDVMETCVKEMDDVVKSCDKEVTFIGWREVRELAKAIRSKLEMANRDAPFVNNPDWGDAADNLFDMTCRKARRVLRNDAKIKKAHK